MKRILLFSIAILTVASIPVRAQDAALEERVNKLNGYVQDLLAAQDAQRKQIDALAKDIQGLREKVAQSTPDAATQEDLRKIAEKIQEVDEKRKADTERIAKEIEALGKAASKSKTALKPIPADNPANPGTGSEKEKGYEYEIKSGDTLWAIVAAYKEQGIKVTEDQILKANPGLKANNMKVGQKIFIPAPK